MDMNINSAQCLRDVSFITFTRIYNVCAGTSSDIPWGIGEWLVVVILLAVLAGPVAFYIWMNYPRWLYLRRKRRAAP